MKNKTFRFLSILLLSAFAALSYAQEEGTIRGKILDEATGEPMMFCNIVVAGTGTGSQTDMDGNFEFQLPTGIYTLESSYVGYATKTIEGVEVKNNEITVLNFNLAEASLELNTVVVQAKRIDRTENALLALQKSAMTIQDGISSQEMSRFGTSNAAESMKRVTGASVEDGKFVVVRGLGDRYSSAQLNNQPLPSTDPYRNSSPLDLIPSNLVENVIASKTFTPDQPGSFTGGNVNIKTKSFPEQFTLSFGASVSYNTESSLRDDLPGQKGGSLDWLGFDDGFRERPAILQNEDVLERIKRNDIYIKARRDDEVAGLIDETSKSVNSQMVPTPFSSPLNHSFNFSMGNQYQLAGNPLGILMGINYSRGITGYTGAQFDNWFLAGAGADGLANAYELSTDASNDNPQVGGLLNLAYKFSGANKISFNALYNHDAEISSSYRVGINPSIISGDNVFETRTISFKEREILSYQLNGEHVFKGLGNTELDWGVSMVNSNQQEPDLRFFANTYKYDEDDEENQYFISPSEYDLPFHYWRDLQDEQVAGKIDISIPLGTDPSNANKIKFGAAYSKKDRTFDEIRFQYQVSGTKAERYAGDNDAFFGPGNVGQIGYDDRRNQNLIGMFLTNEYIPANNYSGSEEILAGYLMGMYEIGRFRFIGGARAEKSILKTVSQDSSKPEGNIDNLDLLPSLNVVYKLNDAMNIRASYTHTLARPNLREVAPFSSFGFIGEPLYTGNPELEITLAKNYDLRWEWYPSPGELFAISAYYKSFQNPIIQTFILESQNPEIKFINVDDAMVTGLELEFRKSLGFISPVLSPLKLSSNFSYILSERQIREEELATILPRNPDFGDTRPFFGQSPYLFNASLNWNDVETGWDLLVSFNSFGERLKLESQNGTPDIYEQPFHQLDFIVKKSFANRYTIKASAKNLLDSKIKWTQEYNNEEYIYRLIPKGMSFGLGVSYQI